MNPLVTTIVITIIVLFFILLLIRIGKKEEASNFIIRLLNRITGVKEDKSGQIYSLLSSLIDKMEENNQIVLITLKRIENSQGKTRLTDYQTKMIFKLVFHHFITDQLKTLCDYMNANYQCTEMDLISQRYLVIMEEQKSSEAEFLSTFTTNVGDLGLIFRLLDFSEIVNKELMPIMFNYGLPVTNRLERMRALFENIQSKTLVELDKQLDKHKNEIS